MDKNKNNEEYKLIEFYLDPKKTDGLNLISIVTEPAMEGDGIKFFNKKKKKEERTIQFSEVKDEETGELRGDITGLVMRPNKRILREHNGQYFECIFSPETVRNSLISFTKNHNINKTNLEHSSDNIYRILFFENWLVEDPATDKATALGFKNVEAGDWWTTARVFDKELLQFLKQKYENGYSGFSVEGNFQMDLSEFDFKEISDEEVLNIINEILNDETITDEDKFKKINDILNV